MTLTATAITATPSKSGSLGVGTTVTFVVTLSSAAIVTGRPLLTLNDGGTASYVSGSGTNTLTFTTTVGEGQNAGDLQVTGVALNNGDITYSSSLSFGAATTYAAGSSQGAILSADLTSGGNAALIDVSGSVLSVLLQNSNGGFAQPVTYALGGSNPGFSAVADLTDNGAPDIVTIPNLSGNSIAIFPNNGSGGFGAATTYTVGPDPRATVVADFNGDGKLDLAVVDDNGGGNGYVTILYGNGSGGFSSTTSFAAGPDPIFITTAVLTSNGEADLIVGNQNTDVAVFLNNGSGGFTAAGTYAAGASPSQVQVADLTGNGIEDIIADDATNGIAVLMGNGSGGFSAATTYNPGGLSAVYSIAVADLSGDGLPDVILSDAAGDVVLLNNGKGQFTASVTYAAGTNLQTVSTVDVNGNTDIVSTLPNNVLSVLPNTTTIAPLVTSSVATAAGANTGLVVDTSVNVSSITSTASQTGNLRTGATVTFMVTLSSAATVTGSPQLTLNEGGTASYVSGSGTNTLKFVTTIGLGQNVADLQVTGLTLNGGSIGVLSSLGFSAATSYAAGSSPAAVTTADLTPNGKVDLIVSDNGGNTVSVLLGNGSGGFSTASTYAAGSGPRQVAVADFNGDGKLDLAVADAQGNDVSVLLGNGSGGFSAAQTYATGSDPVSISTADFNGDGKPDLVIGDFNGGVSVLLGNGNGGFSAAQNYAAGPNPNGVTTAALLGNGVQDIIVADNNGGVAVLFGNGSGGFSAATTYSAGPSPAGVTTAALLGNGVQDIIVADSTGGIAVLLGNGSGGFSTATTYAAGPIPYTVTAADVNGDGIVDLVAADNNGGVAVLLGNGSGGFSAATTYSTGVGSLWVTTADVNGDGEPDLVAIEPNAGVSVLLNNSTFPATLNTSGVSSLTGANTGLVVNATSVTSGQSLTGQTLSSGETISVLSGGLLSASTVLSGGALLEVGGTVSSITVSSGGSDIVSSGGVASGLTLTSGATATVSAGGVVNGLAISGSAAVATVFAGGAVNNVSTVSAGGELLLSGGSTSITTVNSGGTVVVASGGSVIGPVAISSGGVVSVISGGSIAATSPSTVSAGGSFILSGGTGAGISVNSGASVIVEAGGNLSATSGTTLSGVAVSSGGTLVGLSSGNVVGGVISAGGSLVVNGGSDSATAVMTGGSALIENHGTMTVTSGVTVSGATVVSSGLLYVSASGTASAPVISGGGTIALATGAVVTSGISFGATAAELLLLATPTSGASTAFAATLSALAPGDLIDLAGLTYSAGSTSATLNGTTLTVKVGTTSETFTVAGGTATSFLTSKDSGTGVLVSAAALPTISGAVGGQSTTSEVAVTPFGGVVINDANLGTTETLTITVSGSGTLAGTGLSGGTGGVYSLTGTPTSVTSALEALVFTPAAGPPNTSATTTFTLSDTDSLSIASGANSVATVTDIDPAVAPSITGAVAGQPTSSEAAIYPFSNVSVSDSNVGAADTLTISLAGSGGTLSGAGTPTAGVYTVTGTAAAITTALRAVSFTPTVGAPNSSSTTTFTLSDKSSVFATATANGTTSVIDTDAPVAPTISGTVAGQSTANGAAISPFSGVTITDSNAGSPSDTLTISFTSSQGTLTGNGLSGSNGTYTLTGTAAAISSALKSLVFAPVAAAPGTSSTIDFTLTDQSSADATVATDSTTTVTEVGAGLPTITGTVSGQLTNSEAPVSPFSAVTIGDTNAGATDTLTITLSGAGGTLSGAGLANNGTYTISGSAAAITAALDTVRFTPKVGTPNTNTTTVLTISDTSSAYAAVPIVNNATTVIDADPAVPPTITGAVAAQSTTSEAVVLPFSGVTIGDTNGGSATDTVTIVVSGAGGILTGAGLVINSGTSDSLTGTAAVVTSELDALTFKPTAGANSTVSTTAFALSDQSSADTTIATNTTTTVVDTDPAVGPTITGAVAGKTTSSEAAVKPFAAVVIGDTNAGASETLTISLSGAGGTLIGAGTPSNGVYTLTGSAAALTTTLQAISFLPSAGSPHSSNTTTFTLQDTSSAFATPTINNASTVVDTDPAAAPTIAGAVAGQTTTSEAAVTPFVGVAITDPNAGSPTNTLTITVTGAGGTLTGTGLSGGINGVYTLTGTAAMVTSELDALSFVASPGAPDTISTTSLALSDQSSAGVTSATTTTTVTDTDPAVAPSISGTSAGDATTSESPVQPFAHVTVIDSNGGALIDTLTIAVTGAGGTLTGTGLSGGVNGVYTLSGRAATVISELDALTFTAKAGAGGTSSTTNFALTDKSSAGITSATDTTTTVIDTDPAVSPSITGAKAGQATAQDAAMQPFTSVTIADSNAGSPTETLTITVTGAGGTLSGHGLTGGASAYTLTGSAATVTSELQAVTFTPKAGSPGGSYTTTFALSDVSSAGTSATNSTTTVTDTDAPPISSLAALDTAISNANALSANAGTVIINLASNTTISLGSGTLDSIDLQPGVTLDIVGSNTLLNGGGSAHGLYVYAGAVDVQGVTLSNMTAKGSSGGGDGLGGGLYVGASVSGDPGNVTLTNVAFASDSAVGGAGAANAFASGASALGNFGDGLNKGVVNPSFTDGGGLGAGGDVFVQSGASLTIAGGSNVAAGTVAGGAGYSGSTTKTSGASGVAFANAIYLQGSGGTLTFAPTTTETVSGVIGDDQGSGAAANYNNYFTNYTEGSTGLTLAGPGTLVLTAANTYTGANVINAGTLEIGSSASAGSGAMVFGSGSGAVNATLRIDATLASGSSFANTIVNMTGGDVLDLRGLTYASGATATLLGSTLTVSDGGKTEKFTLSYNGAAIPLFTVSSDGAAGTLITAVPAPAPVASVISGTTSAQTITSSSPVTPFAGVSITDTNAGATDTLTITASGAAGTLSGTGLYSNGNGIYTLAGAAATVTSELDALSFTPVTNAPGASYTSNFALSDKSSGFATPTTATTAVIENLPAAAPSISATSATVSTRFEGPVAPFAGVTIGDVNGGTPTETLTITVTGAGGTLTGTGLSSGANGVYMLSGSAATVTAELDALVFTSKPGTASTPATSNIAVSDSDSLGQTSNSSTVTVTDSDTPISSLAALDTAISNANALSANAGTVIINLASNTTISLGSGTLDSIDLQPGVTLDIVGSNTLLNGGGSAHGLYVYAGAVDVQGVTLSNMTAKGSSGGGDGLGGGLYVGASVSGDPGNVTLTNVAFASDSAVGGAGAANAFASGASALGNFGDGLNKGVVNPSFTDGGGLGAGGDVFVQSGASLTIAGGSNVAAGTVAGGAGYSGSTTKTSGASGVAFANAIYLQGSGGTLTFAPTTTETVSGVIGDDQGSGAAANYNNYFTNYTEGSTGLTLAGPGTLVLTAANTYTGANVINAGTLEIGSSASAGSGAMVFGSGSGAVNATLRIDATLASGSSFANTIVNMTGGDVLDLRGLTYASGATATLLGSTLTVSDGGKTEKFTLSYNGAAIPLFTVSSDGAAGTLITAVPAPAPVASVISGTTSAQTITSSSPVTPFAGVSITDTNAGATDTLTITASGAAGTLSGTGLYSNGNGIYTLAGAAATVTSELDALSFTPVTNAPGASYTSNFALSDKSSGFATPTTATTAVIENLPAAAPSISATSATVSTRFEGPVAPFAGVTIGDVNGGTPTETLTITVTGAGGTLTGTGLSSGANGVYMLSGSAATVTAELDALVFTSKPGTASTPATSNIAVSDSDSLGQTSNSSTVTVTDSDTPISSLAALDTAISNANALSANAGTVIINLASNTTISLGSGTLDSIDLQPGVTLDIVGSNTLLNGGGSAHGLYVYAGAVDVQGVTLSNMTAKGSSGGGDGLGGGLYVGASVSGDPGNVTLTNVAFASDSAVGGAGAANAFASGASALGNFGDGLNKGVVNPSFTDGGGLGAGGDVFVQSGASLTIAGGSNVAAGTVAGGAGYSGSTTKTSGASGVAFANAIYLQGSGGTLTFVPTTTETVSGVIGDDQGSGAAANYNNYFTNYTEGSTGLTLAGPGTLVLTAANTYTGANVINAGTLEIGSSASAGSGAMVFGSGSGAVNATLRIDATPTSGSSFANTIVNMTGGDVLDLRGLTYASGATATLLGSSLTVSDGGKTEKFTLSYSLTTTTTFTVAGDGAGGTLITAVTPPTPAAPVITGTVAGQATTGQTSIKPFAGVSVTDTNAGATDTLSITLAGAGTLSGSGLYGGTDGVYTLAGTPAMLTSELDALSFTPSSEPAGQYTTTVTLSDKSTGFASATTNSTTTVVDTVAAVGTPQALFARAFSLAVTNSVPLTNSAPTTNVSGILIVEPATLGSITNDVLTSGAVAYVYSGGVATGTTVESAAVLLVSSGGSVSGTAVSSGGEAFIYAAGQAGFTTISSGGSEYVASGGTTTSTTVLSGGVEILQSGGSASDVLVSAGGGIDLTGFAYASSDSVSFSSASDQLTVSGGGVTQTLQLAPTTNGVMFTAASDGATGTLLTATAKIAPVTLVAPSISGTVAGQTTASEASVTPFSAVTITDPNAGATETLTINLFGAGGTLSLSQAPSALSKVTSATYALTGSAELVTAEVDGLSFTPNAGQPATTTTTEFALTDASSVGLSSPTDTTTTVADTDPPVPTTVSGTVIIEPATGSSVVDDQLINGAIAYVYSGGTATSTTVSSGGLLLVSSGGVASTTTVSSGGQEFVYSAGQAEFTTVSSGGSETVASGGATISTTVQSGGTEIVQNGGNATDLILAVGGSIDLAGLAYANGASVSLNAATELLIVNSGDSSASLLLGSVTSGETFSTAPDSATGTLLIATGAAAVALAPTISGTVAGQTTNSEAPVAPFSGVTITDPNAGAADTLTIVLSGGGGTLALPEVPGALTQVTSNTYSLTGAASLVTSGLDDLLFTPSAGAPGTTTITTFGLTDASSAGASSLTNSATTVADTDPPVPTVITGALVVEAATGGSSIDAQLTSGAIAYVYSGGVATSTTVSAGAEFQILSGGIASATAVSAGGQVFVYSGGAGSATTVSSGGIETVSSGGTTSGTTLLSGGVESVQTGGTATGLLVSTGGIIDLANFAYSAGITVSFNSGSDVLTVSGGGQAQTLQLGSVTNGDTFTAATDGLFGTDLTATVIPPPPSVPTISGTVAGQSTTYDAPITPFSGVTITDANIGAVDTLTITLSGAGGTLSDGSGFSALTESSGGTYTLTGPATALTYDLDALEFTPSGAGTTNFTLSDASSAGTTSTADTTTSVIDTNAYAPRSLLWTGGGGSGAAFTNQANWDDTTNGNNPALWPENLTDTVEFGSAGGTITGIDGAASVVFAAGAWGLGAGAALTTPGTLNVGTSGYADLSLTAGATLDTTSNSVITSSADAAGSIINVIGANSEFTVAGTLVAGQDGAGTLNIAQAGTVTGAAATLGANAGADGIISVQGSLSDLSLTGNLVVGGAATGELDVLGGASVTAANLSIGTGGATSTGNVDIEGAGSELVLTGASLNVGAVGNGGAVLTVGVGTTLDFNGAIVEAGKASINDDGGVIDPATVTYSGASNSLTGTLLVQQYIDTAGANTAGSGISIVDGTALVTAPMILFGTTVANAQTNITNGTGNGVFTIGQAGTLIVNANTVDAGQVFDFSTGDTDSTLVIGQVVDGFTAGSNPDIGVAGVNPTIATGAENLLQAGGFAGKIMNYQVGDSILLDNADVTAYSTAAGGVLTLTFANGAQESLDFVNAAGSAAPSTILNDAGEQIVASSNVACYCPGTRIRTPQGEVPVEALCIGDLVITQSGAARAIRWIGRRSYEMPFLSHSAGIWPIRISAGALADNLPGRDLFVSPCHALYLDGLLVPAAALINDMSIARVSAPQRVDYVHIELETHDVIFAEGVAAESYIDLDNRGMFHNAAEYAALYPDATEAAPGEFAVRCEHGPAVEAVRQRLIARAGHCAKLAHSITLSATGVSQHTLPEGVSEVQLLSAFGSAPGDRRPLGVLLVALRLDGAEIALTAPTLSRGFHPAEQHGERRVCWTNGAGVLSIAALPRERVIEIEVGAVMAAARLAS